MVFSDNYRVSLVIQLKICISLLIATTILDVLIVVFYIESEIIFTRSDFWIRFCEFFTTTADGLLIFISIVTVIAFVSKKYRRYVMAYKMIGILALTIAKEVCFYIFIGCYNYKSAYLIIARTIVQIVLVAVLIIMVIIGLVFYRQDYFIVNAEDESALKFENLRILKIIFAVFFVASLIVVTLLNTLTLVNYKKVDNYESSVDKIKLLYLDDFNYRQLLNGDLRDDSKISDRFLTYLSALIRSPDVYNVFVTGKKRGKTGKLRKKQINIECNNLTSQIFSDCKNAVSLKLLFYHVEDGRYPRFQCSIRTVTNHCQPGCEQFLQGNKIVLTQKYQDKIVPAWQPQCNCYKPKVELTVDNTINVCNDPKGASTCFRISTVLLISYIFMFFFFNF
jgi:hypothetical protein